MTAIELSRASAKLQRNCRTSPYLTYHEITEGESKYLYGISRRQFKEHLRCVQRLATVNCSGPNLLHITFDDVKQVWSRAVHGCKSLHTAKMLLKLTSRNSIKIF